MFTLLLHSSFLKLFLLLVTISNDIKKRLSHLVFTVRNLNVTAFFYLPTTNQALTIQYSLFGIIHYNPILSSLDATNKDNTRYND